METIRFAGANRLMVSFIYDPATSHIKAFNVAKIQNLQISTQAFSPRYRVELAA